MLGKMKCRGNRCQHLVLGGGMRTMRIKKMLSKARSFSLQIRNTECTDRLHHIRQHSPKQIAPLVKHERHKQTDSQQRKRKKKKHSLFDAFESRIVIVRVI